MKLPVFFLLVFLSASIFVACTPVNVQPEEFSEVTRANNDFGLNLLVEEHLDNPDENVFVSPLSVFSALSMTANGADGQTLIDMENTLEFGGVSLGDMNEQYLRLIGSLDHMDPKVEISLANSIWYKEGFAVKQPFIDIVENQYEAEIRELDFSDPAAKDEINGWVDKNTNGYIDKIIDQITPSHVMFLVNALFFKGKWEEGFAERDTRDRTFTLEDGTEIQVAQMFATESNRLVFRNQDLSLVELPYKKDGFSLVLLKPENGTVDQLLNGMSMDDLNGWIDQVQEQEVQIQIPRLEIEYESTLNQTLKDLGMEIAFIPGQADLSNIADAQLSISEVKHKTYLEVDESGTTAAAATSVGIVETSAPVTIDYFFNSPFLLFLRERESGLILFSGKIMDPR